MCTSTHGLSVHPVCWLNACEQFARTGIEQCVFFNKENVKWFCASSACSDGGRECVSEYLTDSSDFEMVEEKMGGCWSQTKVIEALLRCHLLQCSFCLMGQVKLMM